MRSQLNHVSHIDAIIDAALREDVDRVTLGLARRREEISERVARMGLVAHFGPPTLVRLDDAWNIEFRQDVWATDATGKIVADSRDAQSARYSCVTEEGC
jgi:hypothetical protein